MRVQVFRSLFIFLFTVCCSAVYAQTVITGTVVDAENNEPLIGATIVQSGTTNGTVTDVDGKFELTLSSSNVTLTIRSLGYSEIQKRITRSGRQDLGVIPMSIDAFALADVTITSSIAIDRKTPVALSTVAPTYVHERLGMQEFPEILKATPGVYAIKRGGGYGDSEIYMRGFETSNIAVMVNGVPMNDMERGAVYWSNWMGLSDVARSIQTQRGLGASKLSNPSVGGSINIVTRTIDAQKGGMVSYGIGQDGYNKLLFSVSTGLSDSGWAMTLLGGKEWGDGYVQGTEFEGYKYFLNIAKRFNDAHQLSLTVFGAPQVHNQRGSYDGLTIQNWQGVKQYMEPGEEYKYNATYGFGKNGERKTSAKNKYHKPQISLNHMWQIDEKSSLSTALYASIGNGYGYSGQSTSAYSSSWYGVSNGVLNMQFRNADGTFAYDQIQEMNEQSENGSQMIMSVAKNNHRWFGLVSTYNRQLNEQFNFYGGIDGRYYVGIHTNEIIDLYNGAYYVDRNRATVDPINNAAAANPGFATEKLTVGDVVYRDYDGNVVQEGAFGQLEYDNGGLSAFVAGSINNTSQWRYDRFYYDKAHAKSEVVNTIGFTAKGGANYNINDYHNVFANIGVISRAPFLSNGIFMNSANSHALNTDRRNEKIFSFEIGYGFRSDYFSLNVNAYHTQWNDKTLYRPPFDYYTPEGDKERATISMQGVDATHQGIEIDLTADPFTWLELSGMLSIGDWRWSNTASGYFYNSNTGQPIATDGGVASGIGAADHAKMELELNGVKVGGSAQTTAALGAKFKPTKDIKVGIDWTFFGRNYAEWAFSSNDLQMGGHKKLDQPWRVPSSSTFDLFASYSFNLGPFPATVSGNISNLFDQEYISSAYDGGNHDWQSAYRVFYGFGRQLSMGLVVNF